jgi:hypothetical protein
MPRKGQARKMNSASQEFDATDKRLAYHTSFLWYPASLLRHAMARIAGLWPWSVLP